MAQLKIDESLIRIPTPEERRMRNERLGKYLGPQGVPPFPALRPVPLPKQALAEQSPAQKEALSKPKRTYVRSKQLSEEEVGRLRALCTAILATVCKVLPLCTPFGVLRGNLDAESVNARRLTAYIARERITPPVPYRIIAKATGLRSAQTVCISLLRFKRQLDFSLHHQLKVEHVEKELRIAGILPPQPFAGPS